MIQGKYVNFFTKANNGTSNRRKNSSRLKEVLRENPNFGERRFYVSFPTRGDHQGHYLDDVSSCMVKPPEKHDTGPLGTSNLIRGTNNLRRGTFLLTCETCDSFVHMIEAQMGRARWHSSLLRGYVPFPTLVPAWLQT